MVVCTKKKTTQNKTLSALCALAVKTISVINEISDPMTEEQQKHIEKIEQMSHVEMCRMWRFSEPGHPYFDRTKPYYEVFKKRLFEHFGGFTPEISKKIGW